jgi:rRNA maturation protein Nop10
VRATDQEKAQIRAYVEDQAHEKVVHLEKAASELVGPVRHDIWDVHCEDSRWWIVTNSTNLYDQRDFKSRDVVLTFHVGLMLRMSYLQEREVPLAPDEADLLPGSWRRWEQAFEAYDSGDEAENFQAVGVRLRECLVSFVGETRTDRLVPAGKERPKDADFRAWSELLANYLAAGASATKLRSYLKKICAETWEYVNWLTHAKRAVRTDAEIGLKAVEHLLGVFTAARVRLGHSVKRCGECESYNVVAGTCTHCGWVDESYEPPKFEPLSDEERERRLATPCTPSSDISTFTSPEGLLRAAAMRDRAVSGPSEETQSQSPTATDDSS